MTRTFALAGALLALALVASPVAYAADSMTPDSTTMSKPMHKSAKKPMHKDSMTKKDTMGKDTMMQGDPAQK